MVRRLGKFWKIHSLRHRRKMDSSQVVLGTSPSPCHRIRIGNEGLNIIMIRFNAVLTEILARVEVDMKSDAKFLELLNENLSVYKVTTIGTELFLRLHSTNKSVEVFKYILYAFVECVLEMDVQDHRFHLSICIIGSISCEIVHHYSEWIALSYYAEWLTFVCLKLMLWILTWHLSPNWLTSGSSK
uniref:Uncharacterized protein n=1 Tax=Glossina pallidipes TaxID=7398 RepID=A0A1B0AJR5_GLOPL